MSMMQSKRRCTSFVATHCRRWVLTVSASSLSLAVYFLIPHVNVILNGLRYWLLCLSLVDHHVIALKVVLEASSSL
jgi:hypothetical protein